MTVVTTVAVIALVFGIASLDATCNHPLAPWLIIDISVRTQA